jgi:hypothetical protein
VPASAAPVDPSADAEAELAAIPPPAPAALAALRIQQRGGNYSSALYAAAPGGHPGKMMRLDNQYDKVPQRLLQFYDLAFGSRCVVL